MTKMSNPPPLPSQSFSLSFPTPSILLVTITRPHRMNAIGLAGHYEAASLWTWFDEEPALRVAIITGEGEKAFCAGMDLLETLDNNKNTEKEEKKEGPSLAELGLPVSGFAGLSRRRGKKPVIAAVNGFALGGGLEICLNCDMILSTPTASFSLPEVERGLYAAAGGLSRIVRTLGMPLASELALTGRRITAQEALSLRLINRVVSKEDLLKEAIALAERVAGNSPDAVIVSRDGLREAWECGSVEVASRRTDERYRAALMKGENLRRGLVAFAKKEKPVWVGSKL